MELTEKKKGDITLLKLHGKLDAVQSPELEKKICEFLHAENVKLLLDLSDVTLISSAGLRMLISLQKQAKTQSGMMVICGVKEQVMETMKICGCNALLETAANEEEALRKF